MRLLYILPALFIIACYIHNNYAAILTLQGVIRDQAPTRFKGQISVVDFEGRTGNDKGAVRATLGSDRKPVYAWGPNRSRGGTIHSENSFFSWFHNTNTTRNIPYNITLSNATTLSSDPRIFCYDNQYFFPINNRGWGNEGMRHNYHFCMETHAQFRYSGGEVFDFRGDDDVWVFINNNRVVDLGGVHAPQNATVYLDRLGLTVGRMYPFDFFFCERHTPGSSLKMCTSIVVTCTFYDWCGLCNGDGQSCCVGANNCNDNNPCTEDLCDPVQGAAACRHISRNCTDNNLCTIDTCSETEFCSFTPKNCNDNNMCTSDSCRASDGSCVNSPINCDDNNTCTLDTCSPSSGCVHTYACDDNDECTVDSCDPVEGCVNTPVVCDDSSMCTIDSCNKMTGCQYVPVNCNDNNTCTSDSCETAVGCVYTAITSGSCVACPPGSVWNGTACEDLNCPPGTFNNGTACINNPNNLNAFGFSKDGAMGLSTTTTAPTPLPVPDVPNRSVVKIAVSARHAVIITNLQEIYAAGANGNGQLGLGDLNNRARFTKVSFFDGMPVETASAGLFHTLVMLENGDVYGFGRNAEGQLGVGTAIALYSTPVKVTTPANVVGVATGYRHSLIWTTTQVYTFGAGHWGQTGLNSLANNNAPRLAFTAPSGTTINQCTAGGHSSICWTASGIVFSFGANAYGNLGVGDAVYRMVPTRVTLPAIVVAVTMAEQHSLFLTAGGDLYGTGNNTFGQLGLGDTTTRLSPVKIPFFDNVAESIVGIGNGYTHSMVWTATKLYVWGNNLKNQIGFPRATIPSMQTVPRVHPYFNNQTVITANSKGAYSLVLSKNM